MSLSHLHIDGERTPLRIRSAVRWWSRLVGLLATPKLEDPCGLWIQPCNSVHTIGMRYAIDVIFVNRDGTIAKIVDRLPPWRAAGCRKAKSTLELRAGLAHALSLKPGMMVELREADGMA